MKENQVTGNDAAIPDFTLFLAALPSGTEITVVIKTHKVRYEICPVRKAVPHFRSAEFLPGDWTGERAMAGGATFLVGITPSPFMTCMASLLAERAIPLKGVYLWTELVTRSFGCLPEGWCLICHDNHLMVCEDGFLRMSRPCYLPLEQELPAVLRYLGRFGYEEGTTLPLLTAKPVQASLPPAILQEVRLPLPQSFQGLQIHIPLLKNLKRLHQWPCRIRKLACSLAVLNMAGILLSGWQNHHLKLSVACLHNQILTLPAGNDLDDRNMRLFARFREFITDRPDPLKLFRQLMPVIQEKAAINYLHWVADPFHLALHMELKPDTPIDPLLLAFQNHFPGIRIHWQPDRDNSGEPLKGVLSLG